MTARLPSRIDALGIFENGESFHRVSHSGLNIPFSPFGLLFGTPKEVQVGRNGLLVNAWGGTSNYYVLSNPGVRHHATVNTYGYVWEVIIDFITSNPENFILSVKHPVLDETFYIRNATQLFYFLQWNTLVNEESLYEAIILANGSPFRSILNVNHSPGRRRTPYCYPIQDSVKATRFRNPENPNEYLILRYEHLNDGSLRNEPVDICVADVFQNGSLGEVVDVIDYMHWHRTVTKRGKRITETVANYASP